MMGTTTLRRTRACASTPPNRYHPPVPPHLLCSSCFVFLLFFSLPLLFFVYLYRLVHCWSRRGLRFWLPRRQLLLIISFFLFPSSFFPSHLLQTLSPSPSLFLSLPLPLPLPLPLFESLFDFRNIYLLLMVGNFRECLLYFITFV